MSTFEESGLTFTFRDGWIVKRYDKDRYYKWVSGSGLKAVDFVVITPDGAVIFIEVKNYTVRYGDQPPAILNRLVHDPAELVDTVNQKMKDTLLGIDTFHRYLRRRWWYRAGLPLLRRLPPGAGGIRFWTYVYYALKEQPNHCGMVLWAEWEPQDGLLNAETLQQLRNNLEQRLRQRLRWLTEQVHIVNRQANPYEAFLQVEKA